jgi:hypothetical protein
VKGDHFSRDIQELFFLLAKHGVQYLLVGGEAVIYHGYPRLTGDVDLWYHQTGEGAERLFAALEELWAGSVPGVSSPVELCEPGVLMQFGVPPNRIDLLSAIEGVEFEEAWGERVEETLELPDREPVPVPVIGLELLLRNKRAAGRHKDLDDVEHLAPLLGAEGR